MVLRVTVALVAALLLTALSHPTRLLPLDEVAEPVYAFEDMRDPALDKSKNESLLITNCAYGAVRIGKRDFEPDPAIYVHRMLADRFGARLSGRRVELRALTVHVNLSRMLRKSTAGYMGGALPRLMNDVNKVGCSADDLRGGYVLGEVEDGVSPRIVAVHLAIDGALFRGRSIMQADWPPPTGKKATEAQREKWSRDVTESVALAVGKLGDDIEARLFHAPETPAEGDTGVSTGEQEGSGGHTDPLPVPEMQTAAPAEAGESAQQDAPAEPEPSPAA